MGVLAAYRGLAERLACDGPGGHARKGTGQHVEFKPSNQQSDGWEGIGSQKREEGGGEGVVAGRSAGSDAS